MRLHITFNFALQKDGMKNKKSRNKGVGDDFKSNYVHLGRGLPKWIKFSELQGKYIIIKESRKNS